MARAREANLRKILRRVVREFHIIHLSIAAVGVERDRVPVRLPDGIETRYISGNACQIGNHRAVFKGNHRASSIKRPSGKCVSDSRKSAIWNRKGNIVCCGDIWHGPNSACRNERYLVVVCRPDRIKPTIVKWSIIRFRHQNRGGLIRGLHGPAFKRITCSNRHWQIP